MALKAVASRLVAFRGSEESFNLKVGIVDDKPEISIKNLQEGQDGSSFELEAYFGADDGLLGIAVNGIEAASLTRAELEAHTSSNPLAIAGAYGTLELSHGGTGISAKYTRAAHIVSDGEDVFSFSITDGDGDVAEASFVYAAEGGSGGGDEEIAPIELILPYSDIAPLDQAFLDAHADNPYLPGQAGDPDWSADQQRAPDAADDDTELACNWGVDRNGNGLLRVFEESITGESPAYSGNTASGLLRYACPDGLAALDVTVAGETYSFYKDGVLQTPSMIMPMQGGNFYIALNGGDSINYGFTRSGAVRHPESEQAVNVLNQDVGIRLASAAGAEKDFGLVVQIVDDTPKIDASLDGRDANFSSFGFGADAGDGAMLEIFANGELAGSFTPAELSSGKRVDVAGKYGDLAFSPLYHTATYSGSGDVFTFRITDADGDVAETQLDYRSPGGTIEGGGDEPGIIGITVESGVADAYNNSYIRDGHIFLDVDEAWLAGKDAPADASASGYLMVSPHGRLDRIEFTPDGGETVLIGSDPVSIRMPGGDLTLALNEDVRRGDKLSYSYLMDETVQHGGEGADILSQGGTLKFVSDYGEVFEYGVTLGIRDSVPEIAGPERPGGDPCDAFTLDFGADGGELEISVNDEAKTFSRDELLDLLNSSDFPVLMETANTKLSLASASSGNVFTLHREVVNSFSSAPGATEHYSLKITDGDGDSASQSSDLIFGAEATLTLREENLASGSSPSPGELIKAGMFDAPLAGGINLAKLQHGDMAMDISPDSFWHVATEYGLFSLWQTADDHLAYSFALTDAAQSGAEKTTLDFVIATGDGSEDSIWNSHLVHVDIIGDMLM